MDNKHENQHSDWLTLGLNLLISSQMAEFIELPVGWPMGIVRIGKCLYIFMWQRNCDCPISQSAKLLCCPTHCCVFVVSMQLNCRSFLVVNRLMSLSWLVRMIPSTHFGIISILKIHSRSDSDSFCAIESYCNVLLRKDALYNKPDGEW